MPEPGSGSRCFRVSPGQHLGGVDFGLPGGPDDGDERPDPVSRAALRTNVPNIARAIQVQDQKPRTMRGLLCAHSGRQVARPSSPKADIRRSSCRRRWRPSSYSGAPRCRVSTREPVRAYHPRLLASLRRSRSRSGSGGGQARRRTRVVPEAWPQTVQPFGDVFVGRRRSDTLPLEGLGPRQPVKAGGAYLVRRR
jgi:hypothetical protein